MSIQWKNLWLNLLWTFGYLCDSLQLCISREITELGKKYWKASVLGRESSLLRSQQPSCFPAKNASGNSVQELFPKRLLRTRDFPHWFCTLNVTRCWDCALFWLMSKFLPTFTPFLNVVRNPKGWCLPASYRGRSTRKLCWTASQLPYCIWECSDTEVSSFWAGTVSL